jgi:hypothetical protein
LVDTPAPYDAPPHGARRTGTGASEGWGPSTAVQSASAQRAAHQHQAPPFRLPSTRNQPRRGRAAAAGAFGTSPALHEQAPTRGTRSAAPGRGLEGWAALLVLVVIAGVGGIVDKAGGTQSRGGFNIAIIVASVVAILVVRRSSMFPVVVAPPIVYAIGSGGMLYLRSNGLHDHKVLFDAAANWLVYGFPAMAAATAAVLIIAGIRMITHR